MFKNLSLRKKIIFTQIILFVLIFAALFPLIEKMASRLVRDSLIESTSDLKARLQKATTFNELKKAIEEQQYYAFFRINIINEQGIVVYDTHLGRLLGDQFQPYYPTAHNEVEDALKKGVGYVIAVSDTFGERFAYVAEPFNFQGKTYILRTAFPYSQIQDLTENFEVGVLIFTFIVLLLFNLLIWFIVNRFTKPIREIIQAITPFSEGTQSQVPEIALKAKGSETDDFYRLATSFNTLSSKIREQIGDLETARNEKEAILESLGEGVVAVSSDLTIQYINLTATKLLGLQKEAVMFAPFPKEGELQERCQRLLHEAVYGGKAKTDTLAMGDDQKVYIDLIAVPKGPKEGAILVIQDKTTHYKVLEMGKDFVANASHELRTPITIIRGYAETLHDVQDLPKEKLVEITEKIERNCIRMDTLVENLLTLTDVENLPPERLGVCDLVALMENCIHIVQAVYPDAVIHFAKPLSQVEVLADTGLLELAFINLMDNGIKYSKDKAHLDVSISIEEKMAKIEIADQGRGIPKEDLGRIFERFYRVDKTHSRKLGGAGLGLSIVKTIIKKHQGSIEVASTVDVGTTFTIAIPLEQGTK